MIKTLDLRPSRGKVMDFVVRAVRSFQEKNRSKVISCVALDVNAVNGVLVLCLETAQHSDAAVNKADRELLAYLGKDRRGHFNNCPEDFEFFGWRYLKMPKWEAAFRDAHENEERSISITLSSGKSVTYDGDAGGDKKFTAPFVKEVSQLLKGSEVTEACRTLNRADPFRMGALAFECGIESFWFVNFKASIERTSKAKGAGKSRQ